MIETLTAGAIAKLAFDAVIEAGVGKLKDVALEKSKPNKLVILSFYHR